MVAISKPFMAAPPPPPPTNQHVVDMLYQNDEVLKAKIEHVEATALRQVNSINDRLDALEQSVKAVEQLLRELINKE